MSRKLHWCILICALCLHAENRHVPAPKSPKQAVKASQQLTLSELRNWIRGLDDPGLRVEEKVLTRINRDGTDFECTPDIREELGANNVPSSILAALKCPAPPPPPPAGPVSIQCAPAECEVFLGSTLLGTTRDGTYTLNGIAPHDIEVRAAREGYESITRKMTLQSGHPEQVQFTLLPSEATRERWGTELLIDAINALGRVSGFAAAGSLDGQGSVTLSSGGGGQTPWHFNASMML